MELSRGICILCTTSTKVVLPPQAEYLTNLLPELLKNHIDIKKFSETSSTLRVCPLCLHDISQVLEYGKKLGEPSENIDDSGCSICQSEQDLVLFTEWAHFNKIIESVGISRRKKWRVCLHCIKHLHLFNRIKVNFLKKYPHLQLTEASKDKIKYNKIKTNNNNTTLLSTPVDEQSSLSHHSDTELEGELSTSRTSNLKVALKHLKPLACSNFNIEDYKGDFKLLEQVAFVKLEGSLVSRSHSRHGFKKSIKNSSPTSSESETSPKTSFFKIRLKLNSSKSSKSYKVMSGKISKPKSKLSLSRNKKELIVKVLKMDLDEAKRRNSLEHTPSGKKRKSVTFAEDLNVEIVDGVSSRKSNTDGTPLKSLLKKSNSPTPELLRNGTERYFNDDGELVENYCTNVNLCLKWEEEANALDSSLKNLRKPEWTFDSSKYMTTLPGERNEGNGDENKPEENDEVNSRSSKNDDSEIRSDNKLDDKLEDGDLIHQRSDNGSLESKETNKRKRAEHSNNDSGGSETEESTPETPDKISNGENNIEDYKNKSKRRKSNDAISTSDEAQNSEHSEDDDSPLKDSPEKPNESVTKPQKLISNLDSAISVSSDSSREDRLVTLDEYKKIRKSMDEFQRSVDSGKNGSITSIPEDIVATQEPLSAEAPENKDTAEKNQRVVSVTTEEKPETTKDKVSDDESNQSATQPQKVHEQSPEAPADDVNMKEPIVDNDNTVSDTEYSGLAEKDQQQQQFIETSAKEEEEKVTAEVESSSVARVTTDGTEDVFSLVAEEEFTHRNSDNATLAAPDSDRSDTLASLSGSDSYVTTTDGDKLLDNPVN